MVEVETGAAGLELLGALYTGALLVGLPYEVAKPELPPATPDDDG